MIGADNGRMPLSRSLWGSRVLYGAAALLLALGALALLVRLRPGPLPLDHALHDWFVMHRSGPATTAAKFATFTGSGPFIYPMTMVAAAILWLRRGRMIALALVLSVGGVAAATGILKIAVSRTRPDPRDMLGTAEATMSFPSGHTATGSVLFVGTALLATLAAAIAVRVAAACAAVAWSAAIAISRLYLGFHWLSDVAASVLLASAVLLGCVAVLRSTLQGTADAVPLEVPAPPHTVRP